MPSLVKPRPIDHVVLPTADLGVARDRLSAMGFVVAPDASHPFGTKNACVFFSNGTYLEPLAVRSREECEAAARSGNVFVARDSAFRFRCGPEGLSAVAFSTPSAADDDVGFKDAGLSAGPMLSFARVFRTASGQEGEAGFKLAFAADLRAPDAFFFTCERTAAPALDRSGLERHPNGTTGVRAVVLSEQNPTDFQYLLQEVAGEREVEAHSFGITVPLPSGTISVLTPEGMGAYFGAKVERRCRGLRFEAVVLSVADLASTEELLERSRIASRRHGRRLIVPPAPGQGALFAFEEEA